MRDSVLEVVERALHDGAFRRLLERDPAAALAGYDLTEEERATFGPTALRAETLEERMSKTDLTAITSAKTGSPVTKPPSAEAKRR